MAVALTFQPAPRYLVATASGTASLLDFFESIDAIAAETKVRGARRLLADLRGLGEQFRFTDDFAVGERVVMKLGHLERVASLVPQARRTGTSEQVAHQKGMQLRVFVVAADAIAWLSEP